jgi:drug/metabolite transporter (DMT)-like permease
VGALVIFGTGIVIVVAIAWLDYRKHSKALDVLRIYAERGEEPPATVVHALTAVSGRPPTRPSAPTPRSWHLAHVAANAVFTGGLGSFAWWRYMETGEAGTLVIVCVFATLFFAAAMAARLVGAYYARQ